MEIDLDTLIYIFVMILFVILSVIGKKKKPVQQLPLPAKGADDFENPEDIIAARLRALIGDYSQKDTAGVDDTEAAQKDKESISTETKTEVISASFDKYEKAATEYSDPPEQIISNYDEIEDDDFVFQSFDFEESALIEGDLTKSDVFSQSGLTERLIIDEIQNEFDLRKAVIYSEVIKRKYI